MKKPQYPHRKINYQFKRFVFFVACLFVLLTLNKVFAEETSNKSPAPSLVKDKAETFTKVNAEAAPKETSGATSLQETVNTSTIDAENLHTEAMRNSDSSGNKTEPSFVEELQTPILPKIKKSSSSFYEDFKQQQEEALAKTLKAADENQEVVSQRLYRFSSYVDKFFAEESYIQESDDSRMRISVATQFEKYSNPTFQPRMSLLLSLPNTQNRWRIRFQSDDEEETEGGNSDTNLIDSVGNTTYSTAVSRVLRASDLIDMRIDAGIKFRTPIDPFTKFRLRRSFLLDKTELRFTETFQWRDSQGKSAASTFELEYPLTLNYFFRSRTEGIYWDINSYWSGSQSLTLFDQLSSKSIIAYSVGVNGQNEDQLHERKKDQVNEYWIEIRYRKNFYKNWLFYQVSPGLIRPREFDFETLPRLELKLEVLYGNLGKRAQT